MDEPLQKALETIIRVADPDKVILFGSRARGTAGEDSDYDLLVLKKGLQDKKNLTQLIYKTFRHIGASIDLILCDSEKYEKSKESPYMIYFNASLEGKVVYERF